MATVDEPREDGGEICLSQGANWDYPLSRTEKLQRLVQIFERELDQRDEEMEVLTMENESLRKALAVATSSKDSRDQPDEHETVEATLQFGEGEAFCTLRGSSQHVTSVLRALQASKGGSVAIAKGSAAGTAASGGSAHSSLASSLASTPSSSPREHPSDLVGSIGGGSRVSLRPKLPGLDLAHLGAHTTTPRAGSMRVPPQATAPSRVYSLTARRDAQVVATPRVISRVWSLVTPRAESLSQSTEGKASRLSLPRRMVHQSLHQLREESEREGRFSTSQASEGRCSSSQVSQISADEKDTAQEHHETSTAATVPRFVTQGLGASAMVHTPRVYSIRTPPTLTPRVQPSTRSAQSVATPRALSRVWSLVTPRAETLRPQALRPMRDFATGTQPAQKLEERDEARKSFPQAEGVDAHASDNDAEKGSGRAISVAEEGGPRGQNTVSDHQIAGNDPVSRALQHFKTLDDQDELEKAIAWEEQAEQEGLPREAAMSEQLDPAAAIFNMSDARRMAALQCMSSAHRDAVISALQLWSAAAAAADSGEDDSHVPRVVTSPETDTKPAAQPHRTKQTSSAARIALEEARKELRVWKRRANSCFDPTATLRPAQRPSNMEAKPGAQEADKNERPVLSSSLTKPVAGIAELGRYAAQGAAERARRGLAAASGVVSWRRSAQSATQASSSVAAPAQEAVDDHASPLLEGVASC